MIIWVHGRETVIGASTAKSPPTRRVVEVLDILADSPGGRTSADIARRCGISTSTCALVLAELQLVGWVTRHDDRRYRLGSGLFGIVHGLRAHFPLLDRGREALTELHQRLGAGCSMSKISVVEVGGDSRLPGTPAFGGDLTTVDSVGHGTDGEHAAGQRFPIDPPFGLVAMAWRDGAIVEGWLRGVTPRLTDPDIERHRRVLADIRARGYGAWLFDDVHASLHDRLTNVLASLEPTASVTRELAKLITMVTLRSVTHSLEKDLNVTEFVVVPIFGDSGQPDYQIEIRLGRTNRLTLAELDTAIATAQRRLSSGVA
jgi:hypothetical protein